MKVKQGIITIEQLLDKYSSKNGNDDIHPHLESAIREILERMRTADEMKNQQELRDLKTTLLVLQTTNSSLELMAYIGATNEVILCDRDDRDYSFKVS